MHPEDEEEKEAPAEEPVEGLTEDVEAQEETTGEESVISLPDLQLISQHIVCPPFSPILPLTLSAETGLLLTPLLTCNSGFVVL